jgi:hypothetical protein
LKFQNLENMEGSLRRKIGTLRSRAPWRGGQIDAAPASPRVFCFYASGRSQKRAPFFVPGFCQFFVKSSRVTIASLKLTKPAGRARVCVKAGYNRPPQRADAA